VNRYIEFVNARVTSAFDKNGAKYDSAAADPVIGRSILGNLKGPIAKMSDMSTRDPEIFSVFGMQFGIKWVNETEFPELNMRDIAFHGNVARFVATQNVWRRIPCYTSDNHGDNPYIRAGSQFGSTVMLNKLNLNDYISAFSPRGQQSKVLKAFIDKLKGGKKVLSLRASLFYTTRRYHPYVPYNASLGYVVGSIGIQDSFPSEPKSGAVYDTVNVPGKRLLAWNKDLDRPLGLMFKNGDICSTFNTTEGVDRWVNHAPLEAQRMAGG
jgi:hypothetical protein